MTNLYKYYTDELYSDWFWAWTELVDAKADITSAWVFWGIPNDHLCLQRVLWALDHFIDGVLLMNSHAGSTSYQNYLRAAMVKAWEYETETLPEVTWESIVEAWMKNDYEGRVWIIGVIDRMRQILWDEPFNVIWAAEPEKQEF